MPRLHLENPDLPHCVLLFEHATGVRDPLISALEGWADAVLPEKWVTRSDPRRTVGQVQLPDVDCDIEIIHERLDDESIALLGSFEQSKACKAALHDHASAIAVSSQRVGDSLAATNLSVANSLQRVITACEPIGATTILFPHGHVSWTTDEFRPLAEGRIRSSDVDWFISSIDISDAGSVDQKPMKWFRTHGLRLFEVPDIVCGFPANNGTKSFPEAVRVALDSLPVYLAKLGSALPVGDKIELDGEEWLVRDSSEAPQGSDIADLFLVVHRSNEGVA